MEFTAQEMKQIERLRKQDRQWRWARWLVLAMGLLSATACVVFGYAFHYMLSRSAQGQLDSVTLFFLLLFWTKCCFYCLFSVWCFVTAALKWHGDVTRMLLLRLLDTQIVK
jgi:ABC-type spermidine/putrescine transport system permease subunit I